MINNIQLKLQGNFVITRISLVMEMLVVGSRNYVDIKYTVPLMIRIGVEPGVFYNCPYGLPFTLANKAISQRNALGPASKRFCIVP